MHLGIDFGTTRTVVAFADRGNFPVVAFSDAAGDAHEYLPAQVALTGQGLVRYLSPDARDLGIVENDRLTDPGIEAVVAMNLDELDRAVAAHADDLDLAEFGGKDAGAGGVADGADPWEPEGLGESAAEDDVR